MIPPKYTPDAPRAILVSDAGVTGAEYIDDTTLHTGPYTEITVLAAGVAALVGPNLTGTNLASATLPVGVTIRGSFTSIQPASGKYWAVRAS